MGNWECEAWDFFKYYYSDLDYFIFSFILKSHFVQSSDIIKLQNQITDPLLWSSKESIQTNVIILTRLGTSKVDLLVLSD